MRKDLLKMTESSMGILDAVQLVSCLCILPVRLSPAARADQHGKQEATLSNYTVVFPAFSHCSLPMLLHKILIYTRQDKP